VCVCNYLLPVLVHEKRQIVCAKVRKKLGFGIRVSLSVGHDSECHKNG